MRDNIKCLSLGNLIFFLLMIGASVTSGATSDIIYIGAFILPIVLVMVLKKSHFADPLDGIRLKKEGLDVSVALGIPCILGVVGISFLTNFIIESLGGSVEQISTEPHFVESILSLALVPALAEELLFRYLPMKMLYPTSPRLCVLLSAAMFSAAHMDVQIFGYAFLAGVVFMVADIAAGSVIPSLIIHFINNILSVSFVYFGDEPAFKISIIVMFSLLFACSVAVFVIKRKRIIPKILSAFSKGEDVGIVLAPLAFIVPCVAIAIEEIFL